MKIVIEPVDTEISTKLEEYVNQQLTKFFSKQTYITGIDVYIKKAEEKDEAEHIVDAKVYLPGPELYASSAAASHETALNETIDKLRRQLEKYKEKFRSHN